MMRKTVLISFWIRYSGRSLLKRDTTTMNFYDNLYGNYEDMVKKLEFVSGSKSFHGGRPKKIQ